MTVKRALILSALMLVQALGNAATAPVYVNSGTVTNVPQIDARAFVNLGLFTVNSVLPYETQNTLVFTNLGTMSGRPGFRLENVTSGGVRGPASVFYNDFDATIAAGFISGLPTPTLITDPTQPPLAQNIALASAERPQIIINATNVINRGHLRSGSGGLVRILGGTVDLVRSDLGVEPITGGRGSSTPTNFFPESGIIDVYWGMNDASGTDPSVGVPVMGPGIASVVRGVTRATTPRHLVTNQGSFFGFGTSLNLTNATAFVRTNAVTPTNWLIQVVFVQSRDTNIAAEVKFLPSPIPTNQYTTVAVKLGTTETNVLDASNFLREIYLTDRIASDTNFVLLTNLQTLTTFRPSTFNVMRTAPTGYAIGAATNALFTPALLANPGYSNTVVTNIYAAYEFIVTNIQSALPNVPGATITNVDSRVEIVANDLNLNRTRIRSDGAVVISAKNFLGSTNAAIDSPNIVLDVTKTSGTLTVEKLVQEFAQRTSGPVFAWSAMWTNLLAGPAPPPNPDPNAPAEEPPPIEIGFHVLVVDSQLIRDLPVFVKDFSVKSDSVVIEDVIRATDTFLVDAESVTIGPKSRITLGSKIQNLSSVNLPRAKSFQNNGFLSLPGTLNLGPDRGVTFDNIINKGTNIAFNFNLAASNFENSSVMLTDVGSAPPRAGTFNLAAGTAKLDGGRIVAGGEITITANDLKLRNSTITSPEAIRLSITGSIADGGVDATNIISAEGIHLLAKPSMGDFLGTTITSVIPKFLAIPHTWSAEDRGAGAAGFLNNAAVRRLVLDAGQDSLVVFRGASGKNALYVDFLELKGSALADPAGTLEIEPSLVVYFADSNLNPQALEGMFGGRLRWVRDFAGPASSVDVALRNGNKTALMNRALRESMVIDSDNDGIVNGLDAYPLDADSFGISAKSVSTAGESGTIDLSWSANPLTSYVIEYATDLASGVWYSLITYSNPSKTVQPASVEVRVSAAEAQRYYRVRVAP